MTNSTTFAAAPLSFRNLTNYIARSMPEAWASANNYTSTVTPFCSLITKRAMISERHALAS
jgi:hypothetical protein